MEWTYHPDYLGNNEFISDLNGDPYQYFWYSAFGEAIVSDHSLNGTYDSPWRFNGKEFDPETGNYYYGARYYDPQVSQWLSVDPLAHGFPSWTPYHFVHGNPINLIDPTGMAATEPGEVEGDPTKPPKTSESPERIPRGSNPHIPRPIDDGTGSTSRAPEENTTETVELGEGSEVSYEGITGILEYVWTGGSKNGLRYDLDGKVIGIAPNTGMPPNVVGGPLRKGQSAIKIGKYLFNPGYLHKTLKPQILKSAGDFTKIVGKNPDIGLRGTQIILSGAKNGPYAGKTFETGLKITDFIF